jgi:hypothetical protein
MNDTARLSQLIAAFVQEATAQRIRPYTRMQYDFDKPAHKQVSMRVAFPDEFREAGAEVAPLEEIAREALPWEDIASWKADDIQLTRAILPETQLAMCAALRRFCQGAYKIVSVEIESNSAKPSAHLKRGGVHIVFSPENYAQAVPVIERTHSLGLAPAPLYAVWKKYSEK